MCKYSLSQVPDSILEHDLAAHLRHESAATALVLAHLAEVDARKLFVPAGYCSMLAYCVEKLGLSEDGAKKRIQAARAARRFPVLFEAVADRRLHLAAVRLLAPHLSVENAGELITEASGKSMAQIEEFLARCFPRTETLAVVTAVPAGLGERVEGAARHPACHDAETAPAAHAEVAALAGGSRVTPIAAQRYEYRFTFDQAGHESFQYAQALLGHAIPSGDMAEVFGRALAVLVRELERRKFAATSRPRAARGHSSAVPRHIPAAVKRAVWERDKGQCSFVSDDGHRCGAREGLEYDHVEPVARGGASTVDNLRLRCRAHNQYEAERTFGAGFMERKREEARRAATEASSAAAAASSATIALSSGDDRMLAAIDEALPYLRTLGFRITEARRAVAEAYDAAPDETLELRLRRVLSRYGKARGWVAKAPIAA